MNQQDRLLKVEDHSESIWCPHCGEEFGIESNIQYAHEAQDAETLQKLVEWGNELCTEHFVAPICPRHMCPDCWQALCKELEVKDDKSD